MGPLVTMSMVEGTAGKLGMDIGWENSVTSMLPFSFSLLDVLAAVFCDASFCEGSLDSAVDGTELYAVLGRDGGGGAPLPEEVSINALDSSILLLAYSILCVLRSYGS